MVVVAVVLVLGGDWTTPLPEGGAGDPLRGLGIGTCCLACCCSVCVDMVKRGGGEPEDRVGWVMGEGMLSSGKGVGLVEEMGEVSKVDGMYQGSP